MASSSSTDLVHPLVDIGANLTDGAFRSDLEAVLERASAAGVTRLVLTGTSLDASAKAAELAATRPGQLYATAGVHPHHAKDCNDQTIERLRELAALPQVGAIGECGLDYNRDFSPRPVQLRWFEAQVELACDLQMPLFLHEREADRALLDILGKYRDQLPATVVHCFTGDESALRAYLDLDLHVGITGWICDERRGQHLLEFVRLIPEDRLMLETDSPYLTPRTMPKKQRPRRNEPAFLTYVLATIARCLDLPEAEVALRTTRTAERFFGLQAPPGSSSLGA